MEPHVEAETTAITEILSALGVGRGALVELGASDGLFWSNTIGFVREGWDAILVEADQEKFHALVRNVRGYPRAHPVHLRVGCEEMNRLDRVLRDDCVLGDFDLLQIDIDGNDYWVWESLSTAWPKLVSIEYNSNFGPDEKKAVRYEPGLAWAGDTYYGASAAALVSLGKRKGYVLVRHVPQSNLFFVRGDLASGFTPIDVLTIPRQPIHRPTDRVFVDVP